MQTNLLPTPNTRTFGSITITVAENVDGSYSLNAFVGTQRIDSLCWTTADFHALQQRIGFIADRATAGMVAEDIAAELHQAAIAELHEEAMRRRNTARAAQLDQARIALETPEVRQAHRDMASYLTAVHEGRLAELTIGGHAYRPARERSWDPRTARYARKAI